mgnify:CR=1 FL=1
MTPAPYHSLAREPMWAVEPDFKDCGGRSADAALIMSNAGLGLKIDSDTVRMTAGKDRHLIPVRYLSNWNWEVARIWAGNLGERDEHK